MKRLALLLIVFASPLGCKDKKESTEQADTKVSGKGNLSVGDGSGAAQAVRKAVNRSANMQKLEQMKTSIEAISDQGGSFPSAEQIKESFKLDRQSTQMINDEIVILTDTRNFNSIWAYTKWPQQAGNHFTLQPSGIVPMSPADLKTALEGQGSKVILDK